MPFPTTIYDQPAKAVEGDPASTYDSRAAFLSGPGALLAGPFGCTVGRFGWIDPSLRFVNNFGFGLPDGLIMRDGTAVINALPPLAASRSGLTIAAGQNVTLHNAIDLWVRTKTAALKGQKVFADPTDGSIFTGAAGATPQGSSTTASIAAVSSTFTGSIATVDTADGDPGMPTMSVTSPPTNPLVPGAVLSGANVTAGTQIVRQLSGTTGGVGMYQVSLASTAASTTITAAYGTMTITVVGSGSVGVGQVLSGSGVTAGTRVTQLGTSNGSNTGTVFVTPSQTAASTTITSAGGVETKWFVDSNCAAGELAKISSRG